MWHAGGLAAEPSFAFHRAAQPALALHACAAPSSSLPIPPLWSSPSRSQNTAGAEHAGRVYSPPTGIQQDICANPRSHIPSVKAEARRVRQPEALSGQSVHGQPELTFCAASQTQSMDIDVAGLSHDAEIHDCSPQELADHLDKLKREFREICSTILDDDRRQPHPHDTAGPVSCGTLTCFG